MAPGKVGEDLHEGFGSDDRGGQAALHVAGAAAIDLAVLHHAGEGIDAPAVAGLDDVDMRVEMHAGAGRAAVEAGDDIDARIAVGVAGRAFGADELGFEAALLQPRTDVFRARPVGLAGRVDGRKADQVGGQCDQVVDPSVDRPSGVVRSFPELSSEPGHFASMMLKPLKLRVTAATMAGKSFKFAALDWRIYQGVCVTSFTCH